MHCPVFEQCTKNKKGRLIERNKHAQVIEENKARIDQNKEIYKQRQAIVEHLFGTIKRQWGFSYIMTKKGKERASSDVGLMFTVYNLRRIMNLINPKILKEYLRVLIYFFFKLLDSFSALLSHSIFVPYFSQKEISLQYRSLKSPSVPSIALKYVK